jgi:hypothetical protein
MNTNQVVSYGVLPIRGLKLRIAFVFVPIITPPQIIHFRS